MPVPERVLMTADAVGGVWAYSLDLGRELVSRGARMTLAVMGPPPSDSQRAEAVALGIEIIDRPYRLEWMDDPWDDVERAGEWLLDLERRVRPSLVHLNGYVHAALPWRVPVMVVAHSCVRTWWRAVRKETPPASVDRYTAAVTTGLQSAHAVVAVTAAMGRAIEREYEVPISARAIANGLPPSLAIPAPQTDKEPFVLAAGRAWDPAKNITAVCAAAPALPWPVFVAGDDRSPDGRTADLPSIHLLGRLTRPQLRRWYSHASIYALPARYEPFGLTVLEAAAAGCALVLGDIDTLRETWDGAAVFVDPDDPDALGQVLLRLIARPADRQALADTARARSATLTIARTADSYLQSYQSL